MNEIDKGVTVETTVTMGATHYRKLIAAEAKLREAVEVMRGVIEAWDWWQVDTYDRCQSVPSDAVREARAFLATMEKPCEP